MGRTENMYEEIINHLKQYPIKKILLIGESDNTFSKLLQPVFGQIIIDLLVFNNEVMKENTTFHNILTLDTLALESVYDVVVFTEGFDNFDYETGHQLLDQLLKVTKYYVLLMTDNDYLNQGKWLVTNFKKYDVSYFTRVFDGEIRQIYKLYVNHQPTQSEFLLEDGIAFKPLKITFVMPHKNLTGGLKMLYEQMKFLKKRGHQIQIIMKGNIDSAKADWVVDFIPDEDTVIPESERFIDHIQDSDLIFAGFYHQLHELVNEKIPVLYWEQGHEALYGDVRTIQDEVIVRSMLQNSFKQNIYLASDSKYVQTVLESKFHRKSYLLPNFIDTHFYYPNLEKENREEPLILLVGNPALSFKGFEKALMTLIIVWNQGVRFKVAWACQLKPMLPSLPFEIEFYENLPQTELAGLYRNCDILLSCSLYEGCPMPPLEAMASGVAVVATECEGIKQYATHLENALISQTHRIEELVLNVMRLIQDKQLRQVLIENGLKTARSLNYETGGELLEQIALSIEADFNQKRLLNPKKKKVLFMIGTLLGGGAEKVLTNIVKYIDKEKFDVTVQTIDDEGIYIEEVKNQVKYKTIFRKYASSQEEAESLINYYTYLKTLSPEEFSKEVIDEVYDIEIAFLEDYSTKVIAFSPNKNSRKIAWVHSDLYTCNNAQNLFDSSEQQQECYQKYDEIVCVSQSAKEGFIKQFGRTEHVRVIYNPLDREEVLSKSFEAIDDFLLSEKLKIITVGRLIPEKGYDRLLAVHQQLINEGFDYELWILGEGYQKELLEEYIINNNLQYSVKFLGFKLNPYKYMKCCDLFICSSRVEGYSSVIAEALILGLPVLSTDCSGVRELMEDSKYGLIVENDTMNLYKGLKNILQSTELYIKYKNLAKERSRFFDITERITVIEEFLMGEQGRE